MTDIIHVPVMKKEVLSLLIEKNISGTVIDATVGAGGHSKALLEKYPDIKIIGIDADKKMLDRAANNLEKYGDRIELVNGWFDDVIAGMSGERHILAVLMDLGISIFHYHSSGRGFSLFRDEPLDMRLFPGQGITAEDIVMKKTEEELVNIFSEFGECRFSKTIARSIVEHRRKHRIRTAKELAELVYKSVPAKFRYRRIHPATQVFQALRIAVNDELERLKRALQLSMDVLIDGGRCSVITFHSLEDRIVKRFFKQNSNKNEAVYLKVLTKKPICPTEKEIAENSPSRSAKLRVAELVAGRSV